MADESTNQTQAGADPATDSRPDTELPSHVNTTGGADPVGQHESGEQDDEGTSPAKSRKRLAELVSGGHITHVLESAINRSTATSDDLEGATSSESKLALIFTIFAGTASAEVKLVAAAEVYKLAE